MPKKNEKVIWFWDLDYVVSRFQRSKNKVKTLAYLYHELRELDDEEKEPLLDTIKMLALTVPYTNHELKGTED